MSDECQCPDCQRVRIKTTSDEFMAAAVADVQRIGLQYNAFLDRYENISSRDVKTPDVAYDPSNGIPSYKQRLADEQMMADTVAVKSDDEVSILTSQIRALNALVQKEQRENERLVSANKLIAQECEQVRELKGRNALLESMLSRGETKLSEENALLRRSLGVLNTRIEELEDRNKELEEYVGSGANEQKLDMLVGELKEREARIAAVLKKFYYTELSISSVQPLVALCLELNPDMVEQKR